MLEFLRNDEAALIQSNIAQELHEIELLFLARRIPFSLQGEEGKTQLVIPGSYVAFAQAELQAYIEENQDWPPPAPAETSPAFQFSSLHLLVMLFLTFFHRQTQLYRPSFSWQEQGAFVAEKVISGEYARLITALTLHVDDAHLLSNFFGLLLFAAGVNQFVGPGISLLLILLSAGLGNWSNALFYQINHNSIGASTAVFAALGLAGTFRVKSYWQQKYERRKLFVPLVASLGVFALLGTSPQTDVMAHFFGFFSGVLLGLCSLPLVDKSFLQSKFLQGTAFSLFAAVIFAAWQVQIHLLS
ncbi:MAG: hypothetical protein COB67_05780 [SAR324 cluster bacterium]|uniref:Peptidase S54 rhomboid domain-containing protein n=1 Tax=SAR324 cluster bacterium TaxID=2024889 RepID=A0A2A4T6C0_9DELT|nr:MAG: hypothetical protein COB67_05780 [SAR324 cluster bacterium]